MLDSTSIIKTLSTIQEIWKFYAWHVLDCISAYIFFYAIYQFHNRSSFISRTWDFERGSMFMYKESA